MKTIAKKLSEVRKNMKECCDEVYKGADLFVTRKNNENVVLISESRYNALIGNASEVPADPTPIEKAEETATDDDKPAAKKAEKPEKPKK